MQIIRGRKIIKKTQRGRKEMERNVNRKLRKRRGKK
jgi:hypothetical protein